MATAIGTGEFRGDGRGPELERLCWSTDGRTLLAAEYRNCDDPSLRHLRFRNTQVVMIVPEEVVGDPPGGVLALPHNRMYAIDCGRSAWLESLNQYHLGRCSHYRFLFYDELVDVVCDAVEFGLGTFSEAQT